MNYNLNIYFENGLTEKRTDTRTDRHTDVHRGGAYLRIVAMAKKVGEPLQEDSHPVLTGGADNEQSDLLRWATPT